MPQGFGCSACCQVLDEYIACDAITIDGFTKLGEWERTVVSDQCCWKATFGRNGAVPEVFCETRYPSVNTNFQMARNTLIARDAVRELSISPRFFSNGLTSDERFVGCKYVILAKSHDSGYVKQVWQQRYSSATYVISELCPLGCTVPCDYAQLVTVPIGGDFTKFVMEYCSQSDLQTKTWIRVKTATQIPQGNVTFTLADATITQANQKIFCEVLADGQFNTSDVCLGIGALSFPSTCRPDQHWYETFRQWVLVEGVREPFFPCSDGSKFFSRSDWIINFGPVC
jgi:hypothetical protein